MREQHAADLEAGRVILPSCGQLTENQGVDPDVKCSLSNYHGELTMVGTK